MLSEATKESILIIRKTNIHMRSLLPFAFVVFECFRKTEISVRINEESELFPASISFH